VKAERLVSWLEPVVAVVAALSVGYDRSRILWHANLRWVPNPFQDVALSASGLGLLALAAIGWLGARSVRARPWSAGDRVIGASGIVLLAFSSLSAIGAPAPILSLARTVEVAVGLLAYLAVARRPRLARWLLVGFASLILVQIPIIVLQETTQSTFPDGQFIYDWGADLPASASGAAVVIGADGARWQRAQGTFPHPNVLGGFLAGFIVLVLPRLTSTGRARTIGFTIWAIAWLELFLTFSRAAVLAALIGCAAWMLGKARLAADRRSLVRLAWPPLLTLGVAAAVSGPFLFARLDPTTSQLTSAPVAGRVLLVRIALGLVQMHPLLGIGAGNFSVVESLPPLNSIAVDPVHVVPLLVAAEAGIPAGVAWLGVVVGDPVAICWRRGRIDRAAIARFALPFAVLTSALLDHYLWTLAPGRALFWVALGVWAATWRRDDNLVRRTVPATPDDVLKSEPVGAPAR
jgi:O-antigen ligase